MTPAEQEMKIFESITKNWSGTMMIFPNVKKNNEISNIVINASDILEVIRKAISEANE